MMNSVIYHFDVEQNTPEWDALHVGIPTASEFKRIATTKGKRSESLEGYAAELAAESFAGMRLDRWAGNAATERGHELEDAARRTYGFLRGVAPLTVGFVSAGDDHAVGASPDGLVGDDGVLELKCQQAKGHVQTLDYYRTHRRPPPDYIAQVQGQMMVSRRDWVDLMFYHPQLPELIIRIERDDGFILNLIEHVAATMAERDRLIGVLKEFA